ncbi:MAG: hypothetical protein RIC89_11360, partial [Pseudomonadales bacterium]
MCHGAASAYFPSPELEGMISAELEALVFGTEEASRTIALLPDIYGPNAFYQGLATHLARLGARVYLLNPFADLGELSEVTREAAFARRNRVRDKDTVDRIETFSQSHGVTG